MYQKASLLIIHNLRLKDAVNISNDTFSWRNLRWRCVRPSVEMFSVHAIKYETLPCFVVMTLWWVGMFHNGRVNTYLWWLSSKDSAVGVKNTYFRRILVNSLLQTNVERFAMLAFWRSSPMSRMFHSRRVKLSLATLALHIFSSVGCKDVRNVALQHVEIFLVDGTLVQDLNLNLSLFPPGREKSIDIFNYFNKSWLRL